MRVRDLKGIGPAIVCALVGLFGCAGSAQAAVTHNYLSQITEVPAGPGVARPGPLGGVGSMTVDSGHLWVAENLDNGSGSSRVDEFNSSGSLLTQINETPSLNSLEDGVAVDHAGGEEQVYVGAVGGAGGEH